MILGLNITMAVVRRSEGVDAVGGVTYTESTVASGVHCRLGNASSSAKMLLQQQGYDTTRAHQIVAQPSDLDVRENDLVQFNGGAYDGQRMIVLSVRKDNLPASDPRSHVELLVQRVITARSTP